MQWYVCFGDKETPYRSRCGLSLYISFVFSLIDSFKVAIAPNVWVLFLSRVVVGLVKQSMTVSTSLLADLPMDKSSRTRAMGKLQGGVTAGFILGPILGSFTYSRNPSVPPILASMSFLLAAIICAKVLPPDEPLHNYNHPVPAAADRSKDSPWGLRSIRRGFAVLRRNLQESFSDLDTMNCVVVKLAYFFIIHSLTPTNYIGHLEVRYGLKRHQLGYLSSYRAALSFLTQTFLITFVSRQPHFSEEATARACTVAMVITKLLEGLNRDKWVYLMVNTPMVVITFSIFDVTLKGLHAHTIPKGHTGAAMGSLAVLQSVMGIVAPLYGGEIFERVSPDMRQMVMLIHYIGLMLIVWRSFPPSKGRRPTISDESDSDEVGKPLSPEDTKEKTCAAKGEAEQQTIRQRRGKSVLFGKLVEWTGALPTTTTVIETNSSRKNR